MQREIHFQLYHGKTNLYDYGDVHFVLDQRV